MDGFLKLKDTDFGEVLVEMNHRVAGWTCSMVGHEKNGCVIGDGSEEVFQFVIDLSICLQDRVAVFLCLVHIVSVMRSVHIVPKIVLYLVDGSEDDHEDFHGEGSGQMQREVGPMIFDGSHLVEDGIPCRIRAHGFEIDDIELDGPEVFQEVVPEGGGVDERGTGVRCAETGDHESVDFFRGIGHGQIDNPHCNAAVTEDPPDGPAFPGGGVGVFEVIGSGSGGDEVVQGVFAWVFPGHERGPCRGCEGRDCGV